MATQSKMIFDAFSNMLIEALFGSTRKKTMSFFILVIIGYLFNVRSKRSHTENIRLSKLSIKDKEVIDSQLRRERETLTRSLCRGSRNCSR